MAVPAPYKVGDVVRSKITGRSGIVVDRPSESKYGAAYRNVWAYWTNYGDEPWSDRPLHANPESVEFHPDPDPLIVNWAVWRLTNG